MLLVLGGPYLKIYKSSDQDHMDPDQIFSANLGDSSGLQKNLKSTLKYMEGVKSPPKIHLPCLYKRRQYSHLLGREPLQPGPVVATGSPTRPSYHNRGVLATTPGVLGLDVATEDASSCARCDSGGGVCDTL